MINAEHIAVSLLEEQDTPFAKKKATLQYRPFRKGDDWKWFWVLHPEDNSAALAHGQGDNRAQAAVQARKKARELGVVISSVDVLH